MISYCYASQSNTWCCRNFGGRRIRERAAATADSGTVKRSSTDDGGAVASVPGDGDIGGPRLENDTSLQAGIRRDGETDDIVPMRILKMKALRQRPLRVLT